MKANSAVYINPDAAPRSVWHPSQSQFGYGYTDYPDYGVSRLPNTKTVANVTTNEISAILGPEAKELW